ncbi:MAG: hypothetical protein BroJett004_08300 [Planctomycetota bacterium]|nr:MAG: hypothetical protein BroJett004_08300 [Planctomycetota bacterium]
MKCDHCKDRMALYGKLCYECRDDLIRAMTHADCPLYSLRQDRARQRLPNDAPPREWRSGFTAWLKGCFT